MNDAPPPPNAQDNQQNANASQRGGGDKPESRGDRQDGDPKARQPDANRERRASSDSSRAQSDSSNAKSDPGRAKSDSTQSKSDSSRAESDPSRAQSDSKGGDRSKIGSPENFERFKKTLASPEANSNDSSPDSKLGRFKEQMKQVNAAEGDKRVVSAGRDANREANGDRQGGDSKGQQPDVNRERRAPSDLKGYDFLTKGRDHSKKGSPENFERFKKTLASPEANSNDLSPDSKLGRFKEQMDQVNAAEDDKKVVSAGRDANRETLRDSPPGEKSSERTTGRETEKSEQPAATRKERAEDPNRREPQEKSDKRESPEHQRIAQPKDGIGFPFNSPAVDKNALATMVGSQDQDRVQSIKEGHGWIEVVAGASREGSTEANLTLSEARAANVESALKEMGFENTKILTNAVGEGDASGRGKPDDADDANDRVAIITFHTDSPPAEETHAELPHIDSPKVPESEHGPLWEHPTKMVADHVFTEFIAKEIVGEASKHLLGYLFEVGIFQAEALGELGKASERANAQFRHDQYAKPFADAFANLTGPDGGQYAAQYQNSQYAHLGVKDIETMKDVSSVDRGRQRIFMEAIKESARIDALRHVIKLGEDWSKKYLSEHPSYVDRYNNVLRRMSAHHE